MKPWGNSERAPDIRALIKLKWREYSDSEIAKDLGVSRVYIAKTRARMGLIKRPSVLRSMKDTIRWDMKKKAARANFEANRRMAKIEKEKHLTIAQKVKRGLLLTEDENREYMRSKGYDVTQWEKRANGVIQSFRYSYVKQNAYYMAYLLCITIKRRKV